MSDADTARAKLWGMKRPVDGSLWFFAEYHSAAATALATHPQVCLSYSDSGNFDFVCVSGAGSVITDVARKKELWNTMVQAWFPEGPESPRTVLIRVVPDHAEYWDSTSSKLVQLFGVATPDASR